MKIVTALLIAFLLSVLILEHCNSTSQGDINKKLITIGVITFQVPSGFELIKKHGIDSYVGYLVSKSNDTFHIEYGNQKLVYDLFELPPKALSIKDSAEIINHFGKQPSTDEIVFSDSYEKDNIQNVFDRNFYKYDTVNNMVRKMVQPKSSRYGRTGLYIKHLIDGNAFSIYANNLDLEDEKVAYQIFGSIKYK